MDTAPSVQACPRCHAERVPAGGLECMQCGVIFAKYRPLALRREPPPVRSFGETAWVLYARRWLIESDTTTDATTFYGRAFVLLILASWGTVFMVTPLEENYAGESFLHLINLPFHEAGHLLFLPFGRFMTILGGSLGQILMPVICLVTFLVRTHDPFGASVALWWTAESLMDLAPYINDARALELVLLGGVTGKETDGHDWNNLLTMMGWLDYDHRLAQMTHRLGVVVMLTSLVWGGLLLVRHHRRRRA